MRLPLAPLRCVHTGSFLAEAESQHAFVSCCLRVFQVPLDRETPLLDFGRGTFQLAAWVRKPCLVNVKFTLNLAGLKVHVVETVAPPMVWIFHIYTLHSKSQSLDSWKNIAKLMTNFTSETFNQRNSVLQNKQNRPTPGPLPFAWIKEIFKCLFARGWRRT